MDCRKKNILIFSACYLPGYKSGGPIRSISNLVDALSSTFNFFIVTRDRDLLDQAPYPNIKYDGWNVVGKAKVYYINTNTISWGFYRMLISDFKFDVLYLNSFFGYNFSIRPLLINRFIKKNHRIPVVIAPRGEFSKGALKLKSYKKKAFINLSRILELHKNVIWQASSQFEKTDIENIILGQKKKIIVAQNIPNISLNSEGFDKVFKGILNVIFISRISPKKNLAYLLKILQHVTVNVQFDIYGLVDDTSYWNRCKQLMIQLPEHVKARWHGPIKHHEVMSKLSESHLFFLPTLGENFGHAIVESFLAGVPVLISTETPWRNLEDAGVGWDINLENRNKFIFTIDAYYKELQSGSHKDPEYIRNWILNKLESSQVMESNKVLFKEAMNH